MSSILTLLTDFGLFDAYVGIMKGAIASINPALSVIDLTHEIPPQDIAAARFNLMNAYPYFPEGTVHVAVVDPGVGSTRRAIALRLFQGFLVGPDNGLFSGVLDHHPPIAAVELTESQYWRTPQPSRTFHGRDLFAPVGAHLASGIPLEAFGPSIALDSLVQLSFSAWRQTGNEITGCIQYSDRFGNLITNIPGEAIRGYSGLLRVESAQIPIRTAYSDGAPGELLALIGSHGWVEVAVNGGSAWERLRSGVNSRVSIMLKNTYPS
jgi:S-adenosylmethionine hydrolase